MILRANVYLACCGCDAKHEAPVTIDRRRHWISPNFAAWLKPALTSDIDIDGWVAFDPYTNATYCPTCWDSIESKVYKLESDAVRP
jgi:hypothetical protein